MSERRIVRMTIDVLLPEAYSEADLEDVRVRNVRVEGFQDELLYDLISVQVQEARVVMALDEQAAPDV